ncbi:LL-diaminopimelate aminotransferase [Desulfohalovibrio reitneri]|uniref:LL-diaminopimelate aminotransferase n=1 Tax=Desulfohalovibrio reitneri TaxID=1307759 RepID=UPI0004A6C0F4|nr:LL-diaminopimelate aminotransferase [Desulfohalovibrio reitneri]
MPEFPFADRLTKLPPYLFAAIDEAKAEVQARGVDIISLGIGDPDMPTPDFIIEALYKAAKKPANHQYPSYIGLPVFRQAVAEWYKGRFDVDLDWESEVVSLIGSKEGIAHFPLAFLNPGDLALVCTPNYPVYPTAVDFAGGEVQFVPLLKENDYLPDLEAIGDDTWRRAKMIFINYPNNPTAAVATEDFYARLVEKAREFETIIASDAAYTELYFDEKDKPLSILQTPGAKEVAIEFHSLSKTYNMTGWRIGMAVGNAKLVEGLGKIKTNVDSGIFQAVQEAGVEALKKGDHYAEQFRKVYKDRRDTVVAGLRKAGIECEEPKASFYVWAKVPGGAPSTEFCKEILQRTGVVVTPGVGFGQPGEGYFRIALTVGGQRLDEAVSRLVENL